MKKNILFLSVLFISTILSAQSPAGVFASGSNRLWLDASQLSLSNGASVSSWTDLSGEGNHATNNQLSRQPIYSINQINGKPSVVFNNTTKTFLKTLAMPSMNVGNISYFIVFDGSTPNHVGYILGGKYIEHNQFIVANRTNSNIKNWVIKPTNTTIVNTTPINAAYQMVSSLWSSTSGQVESFKNGTSFGTALGATIVPSGNSYYTIGANPGSFTYNFNGGIAEIIMYSSTLNSAERIVMENYLAAKYNLTIANDKYAYQATHGNNLIGIGQESDGSNASAIGITTIQLSNMSTPGNGDYVMVGDNGTNFLPANTSDVPAPGFSRYGKVWRSGITNTPGTVTVTFDISTYSLGFTSDYILLVDGDGVFSSGATQYVGVYDGPSQTVSFTGVTLADGNFLTLSNNNVDIQSTGVTTDWHTTTTWNCGCIPGVGSKVEVMAAHTVNINSASAYAGDLTINGTLAITANDTLFLNGNLANNATFNIGTGSVVFNSTGVAQTITGTNAFNNLTIDNSSTVTITSGTSTVQGFLDVVSGSFATNNAVTMLSNATGTGSFKNPSTGTIVGDVTVQRYLDEGDSWYLLASPLTNSTLEDWNNEFEMQGFPGTEWPSSPNASVFYYLETANVTSFYDGYKKPTNTSNIATNTLGWTAYVGADQYGSLPRSINATGTPRLGSGVTINGTYTNNIGDPTKDGWNLVGNPYQSPVRYSNVAKGGSYDLAYRKNTAGNNVAIQNTTIIAPGEAFWLHCLGGPCSLTFDAVDVNVTNDDNYNLRSSSSSNNLIVKLNYEDKSDMVEIGFYDNATDGYDIGFDGYKLNNSFKNRPNIAVVNSQNHNLHTAIYNSIFNSIIPLRIYTETPCGEDKKYSISLENISNVLGKNKRIVLEDRQLNTFTELTSDVKIDFKMNDMEKSPRFYLNITTPLAISKQNISCFGANNGKIEIVAPDILASTIYNEELGFEKTITPIKGKSEVSNLKAGDYKVTVETKKYGVVTDYIHIEEPKGVMPEFAVITNEEILTSASLSSNEDVLTVKQNERLTFENLTTNGIEYAWDFGDGITSSVSSPEHVFFNLGEYKVVLKTIDNGCESFTSKTINVQEKTLSFESNLLDGVNVTNNKNNIFIYMNNQNNIDNVKFEVVNTVGQVIYSSTKMLNNNHVENISINEASGLYFINIQGFGCSKTEKIVLN